MNKSDLVAVMHKEKEKRGINVPMNDMVNLCSDVAMQFLNNIVKVNLTKVRNELYNNMPTGDVDSWQLLSVVKEHLKNLDEFIDFNFDKTPEAPKLIPEKDIKEKLEIFIKRNRRICWESENENGEYCIGENEIREFIKNILK